MTGSEGLTFDMIDKAVERAKISTTLIDGKGYYEVKVYEPQLSEAIECGLLIERDGKLYYNARTNT